MTEPLRPAPHAQVGAPAPGAPPDAPGVDTSRAAQYWDRILDPQNLEREGATGTAGRLTLREEIEFARTPDLDAARQWLAGCAPAWIIDLGAGLGANAFALAEAGHRIIAVDTSPARLMALGARARAAGLGDRIRLVAGNAEALPFAAGAVPALYTKSVLIHTRPAETAAEIARVLQSGGRAALVEPMTGNPFVNFYRATLAPKAWQGITHYFTPAMHEIYLRTPGLRGPRGAVAPFYFLSFFAFVFMFALPAPRLFRFALRMLHALDRGLFALLPPLRHRAWFGVLRLEKQGPAIRCVKTTTL